MRQKCCAMGQQKDSDIFLYEGKGFNVGDDRQRRIPSTLRLRLHHVLSAMSEACDDASLLPSQSLRALRADDFEFAATSNRDQFPALTSMEYDHRRPPASDRVNFLCKRAVIAFNPEHTVFIIALNLKRGSRELLPRRTLSLSRSRSRTWS